MNLFEFHELQEKYLEGKCTPQEEKLILDWSDDIMQKSSPAPITAKEQNVLKKKIWKKIEESTQINPIQKLFHNYTFKIGLGIAASLLILLLGWPFFRKSQEKQTLLAENTNTETVIEVKNTSKKEQIVYLEDGSSVKLKAESSISYPEHFGNTNRSIYLKGEALFDIKHNPSKPFRVYTGDLITEVLGTSFIIESYEDAKSIEVAVLRGKVSVYEAEKSANNRNGVIVTPNQKITYFKESRKLIPRIVEDPKVILPFQNQQAFIFEEVALPIVLKRLGDAYGIEIFIENQHLKESIFTGDLNDLPLQTRLDLICKSINASFEQRGTSIFITGEGYH